jgi:hypothetical protein
MIPILVPRFKLALPLGTVVESIVGLNTELEVAIATYYNHTSHRYSIQIQSMLRTQHGTATNYYSDACLCAWHPCGNDTISFRLIVSQHCCFITVGMMYTLRVATGRSHVDSGKLPFTRPPTIYFADLLC